MNLTENSILITVNSVDFRNHHLNNIELTRERNFEITGSDYFYESLKMFWSSNGFRKLVLSKTSLKMLKYYKIPKKIRMDFLRSLPNRKDSIQINEDFVYKYMKLDDRIIISKSIWVNHQVHTVCLVVNLITGRISFEGLENFIQKGNVFCEKYDNPHKIVDELYKEFVVLVSYLELTPVSLKYLKGKQKSGNPIQISNYLNNQTNHNVIHVNSNWNVQTIRIGTIYVKGHYRLQRYGSEQKQNIHYKYIFIKPFKKGHTHKLSQKETIENRMEMSSYN